MAGGEEMQFTGIKKYYNSYTRQGRLNVSKVYGVFVVFHTISHSSDRYRLLQWVLTTYGTVALAYMYFRRRSAKKAAAQSQQ